MTPERARQQRLLRVALLVQATGLLALIAWTVPDWIDRLLHAYSCAGFCIDLRGLAFDYAVIFLGPVIVVLLIVSLRWRGPRIWPLAVVALIDAAAILVAVLTTFNFFHDRTESLPPAAAAPPLLFLPALATVALAINLVRPIPWRAILAATAAGCLLLAAFMWWYSLQPVPAF